MCLFSAKILKIYTFFHGVFQGTWYFLELFLPEDSCKVRTESDCVQKVENEFLGIIWVWSQFYGPNWQKQELGNENGVLEALGEPTTERYPK